MKLKKIIQYLDACSRVVIWEQTKVKGEKEWEDVFRGFIFDIPWHYMDKKLIKAEDNGGDEAICPFVENGEAFFRITLEDEYKEE